MAARRSTLSLLATTLTAALGLTACQVLGAITGEDEAAIQRGRILAHVQCGSCHAVGRADPSLRVGAPTFADIARRYTSAGLVRELEASAVVGHYGMPPTPTTAAERADLVAYLHG